MFQRVGNTPEVGIDMKFKLGDRVRLLSGYYDPNRDKYVDIKGTVTKFSTNLPPGEWVDVVLDNGVYETYNPCNLTLVKS